MSATLRSPCPQKFEDGERGFTLLELLVVVAIIAILGGIGAMIMPGAIASGKADGINAQLLTFLRQARERAIAERRNFQVAFIGTNQLRLARVEWAAAPPFPVTVLRTTPLEGRLEYRVLAGVPDTPNLFDTPRGADPLDVPRIAGVPTLTFTTEGMSVNPAGMPVDSTVFIGTLGSALSARAVTIMGATANVEAWTWNGAQWQQR